MDFSGVPGPFGYCVQMPELCCPWIAYHETDGGQQFPHGSVTWKLNKECAVGQTLVRNIAIECASASGTRDLMLD
eukprot:6606971-Prymnesium_polylepis.1